MDMLRYHPKCRAAPRACGSVFLFACKLASCYDSLRAMHRKIHRLHGLLAGALLWVSMFSSSATVNAAQLILRIKAVNPIEKSQPVKIRTNLPQGVKPEDVIDLDGLEIGYDVQNNVYYAHKEVPLGPKGVESFDITIKDIWIISDQQLNALGAQARTLVAMLAASESYNSANALRQQVEAGILKIREHQAANVIKPGVAAIQHIAAYEANLKSLGRVKRDIGHIENLVLATGQDPGRLIGDDRSALRIRRDIELPESDYGTAIIQVSVQNTSPSETRPIDVKRYLPSEISPEDILDPGGLNVATDPESGLSYVYIDDISLEPGQEQVFDVKIRDKWNINMPRIGALRNNASNLLSRINEKEAFASIETSLSGMMSELDRIGKEKGPAELSPEYVAFYREQAKRLDEVEVKINRVRAALKPIEKTKKYGFKIEPPSMKTTWVVIWIILVFLAFLSLLFFLRWYGKTREEQMWTAVMKPGESKDGAEGANTDTE